MAETAEAIARGKLAGLVEYLKSIQDEPGAASQPAATRASMAQIFDAMRVLLPLSLDADEFENPANAQRIRGALARLDDGGRSLERHGAAEDVAFAHLARSLSIDARDIRLRYSSGHEREARYLVQTLVETCVACHSRLPAASAPRSRAFAQDENTRTLPLEQRAKLAYATRQFKLAQQLYQKLLADPQFPAGDLDHGGHLDDYLELVIRVRRDHAAAEKALAGFAKRNDLYQALRDEVAAWRAALRALAGRDPGSSPVEAARALVATDEDAGLLSERDALVEHLEASGMLHRALDGTLAQPERAEAYYVLGLIETRIGRAYWMSQAEAYLETAIRMAPGEETAIRAYALLDEFLTAGYTGSGGSHVPPDIGAKLDVLRGIALGGA